MRTLVTGASGFIGGRLVRELCRRGDEVLCLVRPTSPTSQLRDVPVTFIEGNLCDRTSLVRAVKGRDWVFHLAGAIQAAAWRDYEETNIQGTRNLVDACLAAAPGLQRFVFVSSISAAGPSPEGGRLTESDEPRPISDYGRSKLEAEIVLFSVKDRIPVCVLRPPNVLGPGQKELEAAIRLVRRRIVPALGNGRPQTSLVDVDDVVEALILLAESPRSPGQAYFVTDRSAYAWGEITAAIAAELGVGRPLVMIPHRLQLAVAWGEEKAARLARRTPRLTREIVRASRDYYWIYDSSKIERELGFRPSKTMRASVRRAVGHWRRRLTDRRTGVAA